MTNSYIDHLSLARAPSGETLVAWSRFVAMPPEDWDSYVETRYCDAQGWTAAERITPAEDGPAGALDVDVVGQRADPGAGEGLVVWKQFGPQPEDEARVLSRWWTPYLG